MAKRERERGRTRNRSSSVAQEAECGLGDDLTDKQREELCRRLDEDESNPGGALEWADVRARLLRNW